MKHKGIRPTGELTHSCKYPKYYNEALEDGGVRYWSERMLSSGCGKEIEGEVKRMDPLVYCPHCDEWFNEEQFG